MRYCNVMVLLAAVLLLSSCEALFSGNTEQNQPPVETALSDTSKPSRTVAETEPITVPVGYTYNFTLQMKQDVYDEDFTDAFCVAVATEPGLILEICDDWAVYRVTENGEVLVGVDSRCQIWECKPLNEQDYVTFEFRIGHYSTIKEDGQDFTPGVYRIRPFNSHLPIEDLENIYADFEVKASE